MGTTFAEQDEHAVAIFEAVEDLESIADREQVPSAEAEDIRQAVARLVDKLPAVTAAVAATVLSVSPPTVRNWTGRGLLKRSAEASKRSVLQLDPHSVLELLHIVRKLRAAGVKPNELMEQVWWRLSDQAVLDREDLKQSIEEMRQGKFIEL